MEQEYDMRKFGSKGTALARRQMALRGRHIVKKDNDDSSERLKYMEEQLSKKRGYISYEKHKEIERKNEIARKKKADSVDWLTPFLIMVAVAVGIGALLYYGGFLNT